VVTGARGATVAVAAGVVGGATEAGAGTAFVVVVDRGTAVVVTGFLTVVVVVRGLVVDVVVRARISATSSGSEMEPAAGAASIPPAGVCGSEAFAGVGDDPAEPTRIAVEVLPEGPRRLKSPATSITRHSTATYDDRMVPRCSVSSFPLVSRRAWCPRPVVTERL
jgi:hypothetical protein